MLDYIQVLRLHYLKNLSSRQISFSVGCSKTTINDFLKKFRNCKEFSFPLSSGITNELIFQTLYSQKGGSNLIFDYYIEIDCSAIYKALPKKGETLKHLWRKYNSSYISLLISLQYIFFIYWSVFLEWTLFQLKILKFWGSFRLP